MMLRKLWDNWKRFGRWMGDQVARVVLTVFYFTIALPFGLGVRLTSDPLARNSEPEWTPKETPEPNLDAAGNLY